MTASTKSGAQAPGDTSSPSIPEELSILLELWGYTVNLEPIPYSCLVGFCAVMVLFVIPYGLLRMYVEKEANPSSFKLNIEDLNIYKRKLQERKRQEQARAEESPQHSIVIKVDEVDYNGDMNEIYDEESDNGNDNKDEYLSSLMLECLEGMFASSSSIYVNDIEKIQDRNRANDSLSLSRRAASIGERISNMICRLHGKTKKVLGPLHILVMVNSVPFLMYALSFVFQQYAVNHGLLVQQIHPIFKN